MSREFTMCVRESIAVPPQFVLTWTSGLMQFYPWMMRVGLVLHRLVQ